MYNYINQIKYILNDQARKVPWLLLLFLSASILDLLGIGLIAPYVGLIIDPSAFNESEFYHLSILIGLPVQHHDPMIVMGVLLVVIFTFKSVAAIIINKQILSFSLKQGVILRGALMNAYQMMPYTEFINRNSSEYIYTIQQMAGSFSQGILQSLLRLASESIVAIAIIVLLALTNLGALIMLVTIVGLTMIIYDRLFREKMYWYGRHANEYSTRMVKGIQEGIGGLKEIRVLGKEKYFYDVVCESAEKYADVSVKNQVIYTSPRYILEFVLILFVVILVFSTKFIEDDVSSLLPVLSMFGLAAIRLVPSTNQIISGIGQMRSGRHTVDSLYDDIKRIRSGQQSIHSNCRISSANDFKSISLKDVSFSYPNAARRSIDSISMEIESGNIIGLIGTSGSGKTTLIDVILGLLEAESGEIFYNNEKIQPGNSALASQVAYLPQQVFLIDDTLRNNIAIGEIQSEINDDKIYKALDQALLSDLVRTMPKGINTELGEGGVRLSGGQMQRVALARAFYHGRNILVMDESTSALDNHTEKEIVEVINNLHREKTIIVVAHRLTTLKHVDVIYRLENGSIVQKGRYSEIVDSNVA